MMRHNPPERRRGQDGFTLIEIMVALAILAVSIYVLLDSQLVSLRTYTMTRDAATDQQLLEQAIGRAEIEIQAGTFSGDGDFGERHEGYEYEFEAELAGEEQIALYEVRVAVTRADEEDDPNEVRYLFYDTRY